MMPPSHFYHHICITPSYYREKILGWNLNFDFEWRRKKIKGEKHTIQLQVQKQKGQKRKESRR